MTGWLRPFNVCTEDLGLVSCTHRGTQQSIAPFQGEPALLSDLHRHQAYNWYASDE